MPSSAFAVQPSAVATRYSVGMLIDVRPDSSWLMNGADTSARRASSAIDMPAAMRRVRTSTPTWSASPSAFGVGADDTAGA